MSTTTDTTEIYSEVLDLGREKMNEGDYLKLATFLGNLHKTASVVSILREDIYSPNTVVEFDTLKDKHCVVKINRIRTVVYAGSKPNEEFISGSVNDDFFTNVLEKDFVRQWTRRIGFYGAKNIKRSSDCGDVEEFKQYGRFKKHCKERDASIGAEDSDDDEEYGNNDFCSGYYTRILFGIDHNTTDV